MRGLRLITFGLSLAIFLPSAILFAIGILTHYQYRLWGQYNVILDGGVYFFRRNPRLLGIGPTQAGVWTTMRLSAR